MPLIINDHVNIYKTQYSSKRHKSMLLFTKRNVEKCIVREMCISEE